MSDIEWGVYPVHDEEWYFASSPEEALTTAMRDSGCDADDFYAVEDIVALSPAQLQRHQYNDDFGSRTFAEQFAIEVSEENVEPHLFATVNY